MYAELGFDSLEAMIRDGLGIEPQLGRFVADWLRLSPQNEVVPLAKAQRLALLSHGGNRRSEEFQVRDTNLKSSTDNRDYIISRLERDGYDELAGSVRTGRMSAHAAAVGGFRKRRTPFEIIVRVLRTLSADERAQLREMFDHEVVT